ncbi:MAG: polysaccharide deacetylase family protein [Terriglobales bacterium]
MPDRFITISVDDGATADLRTADLLSKYGLQATFYVPVKNPERPVIPSSQIRELSRRFEVGAHTVNHATLTTLPPDEAWIEISESKRWIEDTVGIPAVSFCYPRGKFDASTQGLVKKAGFLGARTCFFNLHAFPRNPFLWGVSTHAYSHSKAIQLRHAAWEYNFVGLLNFVRTYHGATDWPEHFLLGMDHVERYGGIAHLYLHSWEIDEEGQWDRLEAVFAAISRRDSFHRLTNGALFHLWSGRNHDNGRN